MSEETGAPDPVQAAAFDGFLLALRVMYRLYEIEEPAAEFERPWALIKEVAEGRLALTSPGELAARFPAMADFLYDRANAMVADDRITARRVLQGMQESLGSGPESPI